MLTKSFTVCPNLTCEQPLFSFHTNQSIDLQFIDSITIEWLLYEETAVNESKSQKGNT